MKNGFTDKILNEVYEYYNTFSLDEGLDELSGWHKGFNDFDQFDNEKIGSGYGTSFGWGVYVSTDERVRQGYRSNDRGTVNISSIIKNSNYKQRYFMKEQGYEYTVDIPDDDGHNYNHWDKPYNGDIEQNIERIVAILKRYVRITDANGLKEKILELFRTKNFGDIYDCLYRNYIKTEANTSLLFKSLGFVGHTYPGYYNANRQQDKGFKPNYVLYDSSYVRILSKERITDSLSDTKEISKIDYNKYGYAIVVSGDTYGNETYQLCRYTSNGADVVIDGEIEGRNIDNMTITSSNSRFIFIHMVKYGYYMFDCKSGNIIKKDSGRETFLFKYHPNTNNNKHISYVDNDYWDEGGIYRIDDDGVAHNLLERIKTQIVEITLLTVLEYAKVYLLDRTQLLYDLRNEKILKFEDGSVFDCNVYGHDFKLDTYNNIYLNNDIKRLNILTNINGVLVSVLNNIEGSSAYISPKDMGVLSPFKPIYFNNNNYMAIYNCANKRLLPNKDGKLFMIDSDTLEKYDFCMSGEKNMVIYVLTINSDGRNIYRWNGNYMEDVLQTLKDSGTFGFNIDPKKDIVRIQDFHYGKLTLMYNNGRKIYYSLIHNKFSLYDI